MIYVILGNPWDLMEVARQLQENHKMINNQLGENLKKLFVTSGGVEIFKDHPAVDMNEVMNGKNVQDIDELFIRRVFGCWCFILLIC